MTYRHNSTIRIKNHVCIGCGQSKPIFSKKRCVSCAKVHSTMAAMEKETEREIQNDGLSDLIKRLDEIFSKWLRLSHADGDGRVKCYTCNTVGYWTTMDAGHFIKRGNLLLRWDCRNVAPQCEDCNRHKDGNIGAFAMQLERDNPGIVDILREESVIVYKPARYEITQQITEYTIKFKNLKK